MLSGRPLRFFVGHFGVRGLVTAAALTVAVDDVARLRECC